MKTKILTGILDAWRCRGAHPIPANMLELLRLKVSK